MYTFCLQVRHGLFRYFFCIFRVAAELPAVFGDHGAGRGRRLPRALCVGRRRQVQVMLIENVPCHGVQGGERCRAARSRRTRGSFSKLFSRLGEAQWSFGQHSRKTPVVNMMN